MKNIFSVLIFFAVVMTANAQQYGYHAYVAPQDSAKVGLSWLFQVMPCDTCYFQTTQAVFKAKTDKFNMPTSPKMHAEIAAMLTKKMNANAALANEKANDVKIVEVVGILPNSGNLDYKNYFAKESNGTEVTAFIDSGGVRHTFRGGGVQSIAAGSRMTATNDGLGNYVVNAIDGQFLAFDAATKTLSLQRSPSVVLPFASQVNLDSIKLKAVADSTMHSNNINYEQLERKRVDDSIAAALNAKTLSVSGQNLTLSGGNTVTLPFSAADSSFRMIGSNAKGAATALKNVTSGTNNVAIGDSSLFSNTSGIRNVAIGALALRSNTGGLNTAIGYNALYANTTGTYNVAIGAFLLEKNIAGTGNIAIGRNCLRGATGGLYNIAIGMNNINTADNGVYNTAIGYGNLFGTSSSNSANFGSNTAIGYNNLVSVISGFNNTAIGIYNLRSLTTGNYNTAIGDSAAYNLSLGNNNTAIGSKVPLQNVNGNNQLAIGSNGVAWIQGNNGAITIPNTLTVQKLTATALTTYADDAAADADTTLLSGGLYRITGSRMVYIKP